jgi:16S rRNA (uracil1498-N3)-methyltransferase
MDFIVQKATEMGVSDFVPFVSSRSVIRLNDVRMEHCLNRWRKIALESAKQCARVIPMRIESVLRFDEVLRQNPRGTQRVFLWERGKTRLKSLLQNTGRIPFPSWGVYFLVGPEGGFSEEEARQAEAAHFVSVQLGPRTLRADTVGLTFVSILQYEWGDLG